MKKQMKVLSNIICAMVFVCSWQCLHGSSYPEYVLGDLEDRLRIYVAVFRNRDYSIQDRRSAFLDIFNEGTAKVMKHVGRERAYRGFMVQVLTSPDLYIISPQHLQRALDTVRAIFHQDAFLWKFQITPPKHWLSARFEEYVQCMSTTQSEIFYPWFTQLLDPRNIDGWMSIRAQEKQKDAVLDEYLALIGNVIQQRLSPYPSFEIKLLLDHLARRIVGKRRNIGPQLQYIIRYANAQPPLPSAPQFPDEEEFSDENRKYVHHSLRSFARSLDKLAQKVAPY